MTSPWTPAPFSDPRTEEEVEAVKEWAAATRAEYQCRLKAAQEELAWHNMTFKERMNKQMERLSQWIKSITTQQDGHENQQAKNKKNELLSINWTNLYIGPINSSSHHIHHIPSTTTSFTCNLSPTPPAPLIVRPMMMMKLLLHLFLFLLLLLSPSVVFGRLVEYTLNIGSTISAPDCYSRMILSINGTMPGPTLYAHTGDTLSVQVCNQLSDSGVSIHWHGLHQSQTPYYDGVTGVTQCAIEPGACMTYVMPLGDQVGSYFYHAHHAALMADGLFGAIIIYDQINTTTITAASSSSSSPSITTSNYFMSRPISSTTNTIGGGYSELTWVINDWFHDSSQTLVTGLNTPDSGFKWVGEPNSILLNGKGSYCNDLKVGSNPTKSLPADCANAPVGLYHTGPTCGYPIVNVSCSTPILLHLINAASLSYLTISIDGHAFEIIGTDGMAAKAPSKISTLEWNSGERMDVLLTRTDGVNSCRSNYLINVTALYRLNQPTLYGALNYFDAGGTNASSSSASVSPSITPSIDRSTLTPAVAASTTSSNFPSSATFPMPLTSSERQFPQLPNTTLPLLSNSPQTYVRSLIKNVNASTLSFILPPSGLVSPPNMSLILVGRQERVNGIMRWPINHIVNTVPTTPSYFMSLLNYTGPNSSVPVSPGSSMIDIPFNSWVEIIVQNTFALNHVCEQHAWHLHGMHFYLIGSGVGTYRPGIDNSSFNFTAPLMKDSFTVFPQLDPNTYPDTYNKFPFIGQPGDGCGWNAIRFQANNPGTWLFHCHVTWHSMMGMGVVFHVKQKNQPLPTLPVDVNICGDTNILYRQTNNLQTLLPFLTGNLSNNNPSPMIPVTTTANWWDYIGPFMTVFIVIGASFMT